MKVFLKNNENIDNLIYFNLTILFNLMKII